jgi:NodT family efflux transporter outer membrane factor (OMF) lipoprotein
MIESRSPVLPSSGNRLSARSIAAGLAAASLLAGCAVGPDFLRPGPPKDAGYTPQKLPVATASASIHGGAAQHFVSGADIPFKWWELFGSPALDALVDKAIAANPTVPGAKAALAQAQELVYAQEGYFFPTIAAGYQFERQKLAGNVATSTAPGPQGNGRVIAPSAPGRPVFFNFHTAQVTVSYAPDVFGLNRRQLESLEAQAEVQRFELEATYTTLAANVVAAAVQEASVRAQIAATKEIIDFDSKALDILKGQFKFGYVMRIDVAAQEAALAQAKQLLPPLENELDQTRDLLRALAGNLPNEDIGATFEISALKLPEGLPVSLPSKLVDQRPDVRAAEAQLHAANAQVGVAIANRLPQFAITGAYGGTAASFDQMFAPGGPFWNIIGSVTGTVFDGNTLLHQERAADQALLQAAFQYRSTVITAYQNVADSLHALVHDADALRAADDAERAARVTLDLTRKQLGVGYVNYLTLLNAETTYQQALLSLTQAQAARFGDTAALFQALGGGWWNRQDVASTDSAGLDRARQ